jgi:hypothetical protein
MDELMNTQTDASPETTLYKQMYRLLNAYNFGIISFLERLERVEHILHTSSDETEVINSDNVS